MTWTGYSEQGTGSQERGPSSFAVQVPGAPQAQAKGDRFMAVNAGVQGTSGPGQTAAVIQPQRDGTLDTLLKMGEQQLAPHMERIKQDAFVEGMTRAAQGEAVADIANTQPWMTKVFGEGAAVEGARAYKADAVVNTWVTQHEQSMVELKKQDPSGVSRYLADSMRAMLTGDPQTDTLIQANMVKQMPALIKRQARENYLYKQEEAVVARRASWSSNSSLVESAFSATPGMVSDEEKENATSNLLASMQIPLGVDAKAHEKDMTSWLVQTANEGKFHTLAAVRKTGLFAAFDPQHQVAVLNAARAGAQRTLGNAVPQFAARQVSIETDLSMDPAQRIAMYDALNRDVSAATGVPLDIAQYIPTSTYDNKLLVMTHQQDAAARRDVAAAKQAAKDAATVVQQQTLAAVIDRWEGGSNETKLVYSHAKPAEIQDALGAKFSSIPLDKRGAFLSAFPGTEVKAAQAVLGDQWAAHAGEKAVWTPAYTALAQTFNSMDGTTQARYFNEDQRRELRAFTQSLTAGIPAEQAFAARQVGAQIDRNRIGKDPKEEIAKAVRKHVDDTQNHWFSRDMPAAEQEWLEALVMGEHKRRPSSAPSDSLRAQHAMGEALKRGAFSITGSRLIVNADPEGARGYTLAQSIGIGSDDYAHKYLLQELDRKVTAGGGNNDKRMVLRMPASEGQPIVYQVTSWDSDGLEKYAYVTSHDVKAAYEADLKRGTDPNRTKPGFVNEQADITRGVKPVDYTQRPYGLIQTN